MYCYFFCYKLLIYSLRKNKQLAELTDNKYASLWNGVIYGATDSGEYVNWRQAGQSWSNIKIGNTNSTIGNSGCLVTSIAIKSQEYLHQI